ncbi:MAG: hypothetical protein A2Y12_20565 [Planctomycetes bacterium GWF2_42_9]|nr:MAG: hypothetical protein A2Y12_20565 [Planctomycetes bacterium GWF2_42_9]
MKIGIIGFDTSHSYVFPAYFKELAQKTDDKYKAIQVELGWAGDPSTAVHPEELDNMRKGISDIGIKGVDSLEKLIPQCDAFMLECVNGDTHLEIAKKILPLKKPTFIDKPFANNTADAKEIASIAKKYGTPCWSSSALRFEPTMLEAIKKAGTCLEADIYGPAPYFAKGRGIVYYGIHTSEMIFTIMGTGLKSVQTNWQDDREIIVGTWKDGRKAVLRGRRKPIHGFGGTVHGTEGSFSFPGNGDFYAGLTRNIADFFLTGSIPVTLDVTVEVIAFLDAAVLSKEQGGKEILV